MSEVTIDPATGAEVTPGVCLWCGDKFDMVENSNPHLYCSTSHKYKRKNARTAARGKSLGELCPYQFKVKFASHQEAADYPAFNGKIHDAYPCRCGSFHYGRKVPGGYGGITG